MPERPHPRWWRWLIPSAAIVAIDLATKAWVSAVFTLGQVVEVMPFFNLVLWHNPGAAFSFLANAGGWQRWFFVAVTVLVVGMMLVMLRRSPGNPPLCLAIAMVIGGAVGNFWDRVTLGYVVDFIQLHAGGYYWPAFNVADSAITVGIMLMLWDGFRPKPAAEPNPNR